MKILFAIFLCLASCFAAAAQNEQAPVVEKDFAYKDWTYKSLSSDSKVNLREFAKGKKLVMVVYWAPWCHNWEHDVDLVASLYEKYKANGLAVIGVGEYDQPEKMRAHIQAKKLTFPMVYESDNSALREKTVHYSQRREAGDQRRWGSPWYVFLVPQEMEKEGDVLTRKTTVVNGELIRPDAENYIREKLGLGQSSLITSGTKKGSEVCDPETAGPALKKP